MQEQNLKSHKLLKEVEKSLLNVSIKTKPITYLLHFIRIIWFYQSGQHFRISAKIKNYNSTQFQGGTINILVQYVFGTLNEIIIGKVGVIAPQEEVLVDFEGNDKWGVLAQGHALFWVCIVDKAGNYVFLCDEKGKALQSRLILEEISKYRYHTHTFHSLSFGELCSLLALTLNTLAFILNLIIMLIVNNEKLFGINLSTIWIDILNSSPNSVIFYLFEWIIIIWIFFIYVIYDHYGIYE